MKGYVVHEAAGWSETLKKWMFMPRKVSKEEYVETIDESKGSNVVLLADEDFNEILVCLFVLLQNLANKLLDFIAAY